jgi:hypothetical protein
MSIKIVPKNFNEAAKASIADVIACDESVIDSIIDAFSKHFTEMPEKLSKKVKEDGPTYKKVSAYNMWKKSKTEGDWKTMTDEEKEPYQTMADEENFKRKEDAIKKAEAGLTDSDSGSTSGQRKTTGFIQWKKAKTGGDWKALTEEEKAEWNAKAAEINKEIPDAPKKEKKADLTLDTYKAATRYLKTKKQVDCYSWKQLPLDAKCAWSEFVRSKLAADMPKSLVRELVIVQADKMMVELAKPTESKPSVSAK